MCGLVGLGSCDIKSECFLLFSNSSGTMVFFTVHPCSSSAPWFLELFRRYGGLAPIATDMSGWSDDYFFSPLLCFLLTFVHGE